MCWLEVVFGNFCLFAVNYVLFLFAWLVTSFNVDMKAKGEGGEGGQCSLYSRLVF